MLATALNLARQGISVFPCGSNKAPLTDRGFHDACIDSCTVGGWWQRWPEALVGVPTGPRFVVVDCDLQHREAQVWLRSAHLPETRTHRTRSGGLHFLFQPHPKVRCTAGKIHPHIDTRGHGGFIVWWPGAGLPVENPTVLAAVPDVIVAALNPPPPSRPRATVAPLNHFRGKLCGDKLAGILRTIARAPEGQRNSIAYWGGCRLAEMVADGTLSGAEAVGLTIEAAGRAGLPAAEAKRTAWSALNAHLSADRR
jgi:hypothetical protein